MRILIDLQGAQSESRFRGIGRYSLALAKAVARHAGTHETWIALNAALDPASVAALRTALDGLVPAERIRLFDVPAPVAANVAANAWRAQAANAIRADFLRRLQPDVLLVSSLFEGWLDDAALTVGLLDAPERTAVVLYDLIPWLDPATYLAAPGQRAWYEEKLAALKQAGLLLAISEHTRREALAALDLPEARVVNISAAVEASFRVDPTAARAAAALAPRLGITRPFALYVPGGFDPRKNFDHLFAAWALLPAALRTGHQLVIASRIGETQRRQLERAAAAAGLAAGELILTGYVEDADLRTLYGVAEVFVFPSRREGFGLPALEAMACGAPAIGAAGTAVAEVIARPDALFDPEDPAAIAACLAAVLQDPARRAELRAHGIGQAASFSWDEVARRTLAAIEQHLPPPAASAAAEPLPLDAAADLVAALAAAAGATRTSPTPADLLAAADCIAANLGPAGLPQLLVDISEIVQKDARTGIQRVVRSLLAELLAAPPAGFSVVPVYFTGRRYQHARAFTARLLGAAPEQPDADEIVDFHQGDIYLALDLNAMSEAVHACHRLMRRRGVRLHFVIYDILLLRHPEWWPEGYATVFATWLRNIAAVGERFACISAAVAADVQDWLAANLPDRAAALSVGSFHLGADIENSAPSRGMPPDADGVLAQLAAQPAFLMVGTLEPRKGHAQTLAAFERLWQDGAAVSLVIVGKQGWQVEALAARLNSHPERGRRLFWLAGISDEYLEKIYAACRCLIVASEGEGFGLPLIEAARHGLPILARDLPVFREVAGDCASYFSGLDAAALAGAVSAWLAAGASVPSSASLPWLTWQQSARQLIACLGLPPADISTVSDLSSQKTP